MAEPFETLRDEAVERLARTRQFREYILVDDADFAATFGPMEEALRPGSMIACGDPRNWAEFKIEHQKPPAINRRQLRKRLRAKWGRF